MTKEEFVRRWKNHVAGMALFGMASERNDGPFVRAAKVFDIPKNVEDLLGKMYDDLAAKPINGNGAPLPVKVQR